MRYVKVRTVMQDPKSRETYVKIDYYDKETDMDDCLDESFVQTTRSYYEKNKFLILKIDEKAIEEDEYLQSTFVF